MANNVDPYQIPPSGAVWSGSALFAYAILLGTLVYEILGHWLYILKYLYGLCLRVSALLLLLLF